MKYHIKTHEEKIAALQYKFKYIKEGKDVLFYRTILKISATELGKSVGVSRQTINSIEKPARGRNGKKGSLIPSFTLLVTIDCAISQYIKENNLKRKVKNYEEKRATINSLLKK